MDTLLLFHWNECGACKAYIPTFDEIANDNKIPFVKIELSATMEKGNGGENLSPDALKEILKWKETVVGYPTLAKWDGTKVTEFPADKNRDDKKELINFVSKTTLGGRRRRFKRRFTEKNGYKGYNYTANRGTRGLNLIKRLTRARGRHSKRSSQKSWWNPF
jgi:thiol-disulfide isomerase/thioredoxin